LPRSSEIPQPFQVSTQLLWSSFYANRFFIDAAAQKGTSNNLFKMTAKRRRSKAEIKEAERQETLKKNEITNKVLEMNMMRQRMEELEE